MCEERVSLFLTSLAGGGAERAMVLLAGGLVERGLRVDLVLTNARGPYVGDVAQGVRVVDLGARRIMSSLPALVRYLRRERPGALLSALSTTNCVGLWARGLAGVKTRVVLSEHNTPTQSRAHTGQRRMRMLPELMRWTYPHADALTAVSTGVAEDLARMIRQEDNNIQVIYDPVVTRDLETRASEPIGHSWFRTGEPPVILGAGRLVEQKDFPTLLRAFALVRKRTEARLVIVGEGERRGSLEGLARELGIEEDVALPGFVSNAYAYMARAAVFALSSRWEGLGMVLIEAMACGTPVVSTDCPNGPREILQDGWSGRLVPVESEDRLAEALLETLEEPSPDPRAHARYFTVERAVEQYLQVLCPGCS